MSYTSVGNVKFINVILVNKLLLTLCAGDMMFSHLLVNDQKFVLFVDNVGLEKYSYALIRELLNQQGKDTLATIPESLHYSLGTELCDLSFEETTQILPKTNVILQPLSKLLNVYRIKSVFRFIQRLKTNPNVRQIFLWATTKNISHQFIVPFLEYLSDQIVTIIDSQHLSLVARKTGGIVTNKSYQYQLGNGDFIVKEIKKVKQKVSEPILKHETTFKLELEEDEVIARSAVPLPYERSISSQQGHIMYIPDANDDFDEEDPDDDLCI